MGNNIILIILRSLHNQHSTKCRASYSIIIKFNPLCKVRKVDILVAALMPTPFPSSRNQDTGRGTVLSCNLCFCQVFFAAIMQFAWLVVFSRSPSAVWFWNPSLGIGLLYSWIYLVRSFYESFWINLSESAYCIHSSM